MSDERKRRSDDSSESSDTETDDTDDSVRVWGRMCVCACVCVCVCVVLYPVINLTYHIQLRSFKLS